MNKVLFSLLIGISISCFAIYSPQYPKQNLALRCGDIDILTSNYTTSEQGKLVAKDDSLGQSVTAVQGHATVELVKTQNADRFFFGRPKGFGFFDGGILKLDLRNLEDRNDIYLEKATGEKIKCHVLGDCC